MCSSDLILDPETDLATAKERLLDVLAPIGIEGWTVTVEEIGFSAGSNAISVIITGTSTTDVASASDAIVAKLSENGDLVNVKSDLVKAGRQVEVTVDASKAAAVGLSAAQVAGEVRNLLVGSAVGQMEVAGEKLDISMKVDSEIGRAHV